MEENTTNVQDIKNTQAQAVHSHGEEMTERQALNGIFKIMASRRDVISRNAAARVFVSDAADFDNEAEARAAEDFFSEWQRQVMETQAQLTGKKVTGDKDTGYKLEDLTFTEKVSRTAKKVVTNPVGGAAIGGLIVAGTTATVKWANDKRIERKAVRDAVKAEMQNG